MKRHEETLLELARARSLPIGAIYREVVSGDSIDARPEMVRLLSEVESGIWEGVLVMEVEVTLLIKDVFRELSSTPTL